MSPRESDDLPHLGVAPIALRAREMNGGEGRQPKFDEKHSAKKKWILAPRYFFKALTTKLSILTVFPVQSLP